MRKNCFFIAVTIMLLMTATTGRCYQNEPGGFFKLKWGTSLEDFKKHYKSVKLIKDGDVKWYIPESGYARFSGALTFLSYQFYDGKLVFVNIYFDEGMGEKLQKALTVSFGEPINKDSKGAEWLGKYTSIIIDLEMRSITFRYSRSIERSSTQLPKDQLNIK